MGVCVHVVMEVGVSGSGGFGGDEGGCVCVCV